MNHYQTLGLPNFATEMQIKRAYRSLALKHHPDRGGSLSVMQEINEAYRVLSREKNDYDFLLRAGSERQLTIQVGGGDPGWMFEQEDSWSATRTSTYFFRF